MSNKTPLGIVPLAYEFRNFENNMLLNGDQAYIQTGHRPVIEVVKAFEQQNPKYSQHIFDSNGNFEDKDFVKSGYENYLALSHLHEMPETPKLLKPIADLIIDSEQTFAKSHPDWNIKIPSSTEAILPCLAQIYLASQNLNDKQLCFIINHECANPSIHSAERMDVTRSAFESGMSIDEVKQIIDKPVDVIEGLVGVKPFLSKDQYEILKDANDYDTVLNLATAMEFDDVPLDVSKAIVDFSNKLGANPEVRDSLPYWFRTDGKVDVFVHLNNEFKITPKEVEMLGNKVLSTGKPLDFNSAKETLEALRSINFGKPVTPQPIKVWSPKNQNTQPKNISKTKSTQDIEP